LNIQDLQAEINAIDQEIAQLDNSVSLALVKKLLNLIERVVKENNALLTERQQLRDEINRLKGGQGRHPSFLPKSSEQFKFKAQAPLRIP